MFNLCIEIADGQTYASMKDAAGDEISSWRLDNLTMPDLFKLAEIAVMGDWDGVLAFRPTAK